MSKKKKRWFLFLLFFLANVIILNLSQGKIFAPAGLNLASAQAAGIDNEKTRSLQVSLDNLEKRTRALNALPQEAEFWRKEVLLRSKSLQERIRKGNIEYLEYKQMDSAISQLNTILTGLEEGKAASRDWLVYSVKPMSSTRVLPDTFNIPGSKISDTLFILACPGEYEPASFVLYPSADINSLKLEATELKGEGGSIPSAGVDIKVVKCWYQGGTAGTGMGQIKSRKVLVPELLLNDDSLVKVDYGKKDNYLKLTYAKGTSSEKKNMSG